MINQLKDAFIEFAKVIWELPPGKKIALILVTFFTLTGILFTAYVSGKVEYTLLYSNLSQSDMLSITEELRGKNIQFRMERAGTSVSVPVKDVYSLRLELAGAGLPSGGAVGFEIFDKSTFGMTEFIQKLNFRRALQGELQRTINSINSVQSSRVHIVIPQKTLFEDDSSKATASVVLKMNGGRKLNKSRVEGISYLVAAAVENLDAEDVTIVDSSGNILSAAQGGDEASRLSGKQLEYRRTYEADLEKRIRTMLERAVGMGKAIVRVNAMIDFKQEQRIEELFDPNSQVARSEQRTEEKSQGSVMPVGITGVQTNLPEGADTEQATGKPATSNRVNETTNYEINKIVKTIIAPTNIITKLSVAILVDGKFKTTTDEDGNRVKEFVPLTDQEKTQLSNLVRTAIGFDENRKDTVTIENMQFDISPLEDETERLDAQSKREYISTMIAYAGLAIVGVAVLFVIFRTMGWITAASYEVDELKSFPQTVQQMEDELKGIKAPKKEMINLRKAVMDMIAENPEQAAEMVRKWLRAR